MTRKILRLLTAGILTATIATVAATRADTLRNSGVLGNSGEQGAALVRFAAKEASGVGVACDRYGSLWDRGGAGRLNRYAPDGRLLATYRLPEGNTNRNTDAIALAGDQLIIRTGGGLSTLSIDAAPGSAATPLGVKADFMSLSSRDGYVAAATKTEVFLVNAKGERRPGPPLTGDVSGVEITPDGGVYVQVGDRLTRVPPTIPARAAPAAGGEALAVTGPTPGERPQFLAGAWYGHAWSSTIRRFDAALRPAPGVVFGGNSGSFIGHVDEQAEVVNARGMAQVAGDLFAVSGLDGVLHLVQWSAAESRFRPVRRIGALPACDALALDRDGRVWVGSGSGSWEWADGPATPLRYGIPPTECYALALLDTDVLVGFGKQYGKPTLYSGKLTAEIKRRWEEKSRVLPADARGAVAAVAVQIRNRPAMLLLGTDGRTAAVHVGPDGAYQEDAGTGQLATAAPVRQWTALAALGRDKLVGAADGSVIELARDGDAWRESARWGSWGDAAEAKFGGPIRLAADAGRLWVTDTARHRVICFDPVTRKPVASFGATDQAGDSLALLSAPTTIAARAHRAVVFDSANQRLVRLELDAKR